MLGKFNCRKDEVVWSKSLDSLHDEMGNVQFQGWAGKLLDFYGKDYIIQEDSQGFVTVETFEEHIDIDASGYFCPVERRWAELREELDPPDDNDDDEQPYLAWMEDQQRDYAEEAYNADPENFI